MHALTTFYLVHFGTVGRFKDTVYLYEVEARDDIAGQARITRTNVESNFNNEGWMSLDPDIISHPKLYATKREAWEAASRAALANGSTLLYVTSTCCETF